MPNDEVEVGSADTRADVAAAFDKLASASAPEAPAAPAVEASPEPRSESGGDRQRDEKGRFASTKPADVDTPSAPPVKPDPAIEPAGSPRGAVAVGGPPAPAAEPVPVLKPPQSWTPAEREAFAKAPPEVQKAALRREAEIAKTLNETAEPRKQYQAFKEVITPYEHIFRAAGVSAPQAIGNLLRTYEALGSGPQSTRANILGELIRKHLGTDEAALTALANAIQGSGAPQQPQAFDPGQVQALIRQQLEQERRETQRNSAFTVLQQFEATQPEFLEPPDATEKPVRDLMGVILTDWERKNQGASVSIDIFQQAYDKACKINDDVAKVLQQREQYKAAANANASTQKAKVVSSSVKSQPGGPSAPPPLGDDTRSHVAAAYEKLAAQQ